MPPQFDRSVRPVLTLVFALSAVAALATRAASTNLIQYNRDVRPILSENCFACHGPDKNQRKAKLRLDVRDIAIEKEAIVPSNPATSKLIEHIFSSDPEEIMPPPKSNKKLTAAQKETLKQWIAAGAEYEPHWSYIKPNRAATPKVAYAKWVGNPIDAFILQILESKKIQPSPEADKRTLLRRLSLDLIGIPPTPEEVCGFLADKNPDAYEKQVDRLLSSPHFGERMAVPWLDVVRFADTVGYHGDQNVHIFPYRDYVINAFNRNKPFDQFTIEQLAGDLVEHPTLETRVATGFNRLNMMTREGGAQPKEYLAKYAGDRVRTVSMAWLGSTMGCAECHDHKFDPFTSKDFYSMEAFFADIKQWGVYMDYSYTPNPDLRGFSNDHPFPPEVEVDSPYLKDRSAKFMAQTEGITRNCSKTIYTNKEFAEWRKAGAAFLKQWPDGWAVPSPELVVVMKDTNAVATTNYSVKLDGEVQFSEKPMDDVKFKLQLTNIWLAAIRLEIVPREVREDKSEMKTARRKRTPGSVTLAATIKEADGKEKKVPFYFADADAKRERYANGDSILGIKDLWQISTDQGKQTGVWLLEKPIRVQNGAVLTVSLGNLAVAAARVSVSPFADLSPLESDGSAELRKALSKKRPRGDDRILASRAYLLGTHADSASISQLRSLEKEIRECRDGRAFTMVTESNEPLVTRILARGNWQDESGEIVQPATPHFLPQPPNSGERRLTRLDLARWLVSTNNPLTARAVMNRLWKQFFGAGISLVVDDLGMQGEWPVQPELLDWLACEFMHPTVAQPSNVIPLPSHDWDIKQMVKLMVMSSTYRQNSNQRMDLKDIDPNNRLLASQTPRRLEAEFVRDNALAIAGLLNLDVGGPSVHPYQPAGYYANIQFPDRDYYPEKDERQYRRGVYAHWQRTFLQPMLANFDAPGREECTANRILSNTPQQALTLLNDPTFVEASRVFAARVLGSGTSNVEQRLSFAFQWALVRSPNEKEKKSLLNFLSEQRDHYRTNSEEAGKILKIGNAPEPGKASAEELAAWTQVCRVILNLHETITRY
jgi:hypothetical protein